MNRRIAQAVKVSLAGVAAAIIFCPALLSSSVASSRGLQPSTSLATNDNLILLKRGVLDTDARIDLDTSLEDRQAMSVMGASTSKELRIVQFAGSIRRKWIDALRSTGAEMVGYIPNNAYIIRGEARELARVATLDARLESDDAHPIRWMGRLHPTEKIDPTYTHETLAAVGKTVDAEVELIVSPESLAAIEYINRAAASINHRPRRFLNYLVLSVSLPVERLLDIATFDEVLFVGPAPQARQEDERSAQIVAGNLSVDRTQPGGPGYAAWLASKGLDSSSDFILDVTDSGLDRGSTSPTRLHPDFLDAAQLSRVAYSFNYVDDGRIDDRPGHGTMVASIAAGRGVSGREDASGYLYGTGVDPYAKLGSSRIFDERGRLPFSLSFTSVASAAYAAGARASNNSWGNSVTNYDATAQEYDSLVRDAQPSVAGNQEMVFVFSAGNSGPGGRISSPGTAKNAISVAASENYRPEGSDSCNLDGQGGIGPDGADNALDILRFSSGGPTLDGRAKPDICAPGTHVFGAASQSTGFFAEGLCPGIAVFHPPNQSLYTWSSGTSLAAPHVSGAASLLRRFFQSRSLLEGSRAPSPAMTKGYLANSATYITGANAGGNLPGERQGWGLLDLSRAFDGAKRLLVDQTKLFSESGQTFEIQGSIADRSLPVRVTVAWSDPPGSLVGAAIVNDLDLDVNIGGFTVYRGNNFAGAYSVAGGEPDRLNNLESIYLLPDVIPAGIQGNFTVTVRAANIAGDGVPGNGDDLDQDFALVIYNVAPPIQPPPPKKMPVITAASWAKKTLTIAGRDFSAAAQVEVNGKLIERPFEFDSTQNSLSLRWKFARFNLIEGDNQIVLIENGERSQPFALRL